MSNKRPTKLKPPFHSGPRFSDYPEVFKWDHSRVYEQLWKMRNPHTHLCYLNWVRLSNLSKIPRDHLYEYVLDLVDLEIIRLRPPLPGFSHWRVEFSVEVCEKDEWQRIWSEVSLEKLLRKKKSREAEKFAKKLLREEEKEAELEEKIRVRAQKVSKLLQLRKSK